MFEILTAISVMIAVLWERDTVQCGRSVLPWRRRRHLRKPS